MRFAVIGVFGRALFGLRFVAGNAVCVFGRALIVGLRFAVIGAFVGLGRGLVLDRLCAVLAAALRLELGGLGGAVLGFAFAVAVVQIADAGDRRNRIAAVHPEYRNAACLSADGGLDFGHACSQHLRLFGHQVELVAVVHHFRNRNIARLARLNVECGQPETAPALPSVLADRREFAETALAYHKQTAFAADGNDGHPDYAVVFAKRTLARYDVALLPQLHPDYATGVALAGRRVLNRESYGHSLLRHHHHIVFALGEANADEFVVGRRVHIHNDYAGRAYVAHIAERDALYLALARPHHQECVVVIEVVHRHHRADAFVCADLDDVGDRNAPSVARCVRPELEDGEFVNAAAVGEEQQRIVGIHHKQMQHRIVFARVH